MFFLKKIYEYIELLFIGFGNLFYNLWLMLQEAILFSNRRWWWKLKWQFFLCYFLTRLRPLVLRESTGFGYTEENFIYGETPCKTVRDILKYTESKPGDVLIDLGCGRGTVVFYSHYLGGLEAYGYDLLPSFIRKARIIQNNLRLDTISFSEKDLLDADIAKANVIFIAGTTFPDDFLKKLIMKLRQAPPGCIIVTLSFSLPESRFTLFREMLMDFSWGKSTVYFHRKKSSVVSSQFSTTNYRLPTTDCQLPNTLLHKGFGNWK